jgi:hypothetical protein
MMSKRPVAKACPECGSGAYRSCKPQGSVAFASDQECKACGTRYKPPTPWWAAVVFLAVGLGMLGGGAAAFLLLLSHPAPNPIGLALTACLAVVGGGVIWHGVRAMLWPGQV